MKTLYQVSLDRYLEDPDAEDWDDLARRATWAALEPAYTEETDTYEVLEHRRRQHEETGSNWRNNRELHDTTVYTVATDGYGQMHLDIKLHLEGNKLKIKGGTPQANGYIGMAQTHEDMAQDILGGLEKAFSDINSNTS